MRLKLKTSCLGMREKTVFWHRPRSCLPWVVPSVEERGKRTIFGKRDISGPSLLAASLGSRLRPHLRSIYKVNTAPRSSLILNRGFNSRPWLSLKMPLSILLSLHSSDAYSICPYLSAFDPCSKCLEATCILFPQRQHIRLAQSDSSFFPLSERSCQNAHRIQWLVCHIHPTYPLAELNHRRTWVQETIPAAQYTNLAQDDFWEDEVSCRSPGRLGLYGLNLLVTLAVEGGPISNTPVQEPNVDEVEAIFLVHPFAAAVINLEAKIRREEVGLNGWKASR